MQLSDEAKARVYQAVGQAAMCWTDVGNASVFMTELALKVGDELINVLEAED